MMPLSAILLSAAVAHAPATWPFHNDAFGFSAQFPKVANSTPCLSGGQGYFHGGKIILRSNGDCDEMDQPYVSASVSYNALYWKTSKSAAKKLCTGVVRWTNLKIDGFRAALCRDADPDNKTWVVLTYIAVTSSGEDGLILQVEVDAPPDEVEKYRPLALLVMKSFKLDPATPR